MVGEVPALFGQVDRAAQQHFGGGDGGALCDRAAFEVDDILIAPGDMFALVHDVEADRQAFGRTLAVDVAVGAVEEHRAFGEGASLDEIEAERLVQAAVDGFGIIGVIVADIARPPIAGGQEAEIMVVRQAVGEGRGAAGRIGGVGCGGPEVGAEEEAAAAAVEEEDLRRVAVGGELVAVAGLELGDDAVGEEMPVAREPGEEVGAAREAGFAFEVDAAFVEARGDGFEVEFGAGGRVDGLGHGGPS